MGIRRTEEFRSEAVRIALTSGLTDTLARIADHMITRIDDLLPWRYAETSA